MEKQAIQYHGEAADEEFPDEFQCCVCLDIIYKPVVLACGHISCFWCVFKAMNHFQESRCPVCRNSYNHFPRVCGLLHFLLLKLYTKAYKRRERQVAEEEKEREQESPQVDGPIVDSDFSKVTDDLGISSLLGSVPIEPNATCGQGDHSFIPDSSQRTCHEDNTATIPTTSSSRTTSNEAHFVVEHTNKVLVTDLQCAVCKQLLYRPVVLNCGHVYCEACIDPHPQDNICKCPVCQSAHPKGFPNVCLILEHLLEEHFPEQYSARKASLPHSTRSSGRLRENQEQAAQSSSRPTHVYSSLFSSNGANFHPRVGCDYCGMYPIIGLRYKCKDCVEKIGFDLCEGCHNSFSKLPGRFNQQHTKEHRFEVIQPPNLNTILRLGDNNNNGVRIVYFSNDDGEESELEITASLDSPDEDPPDLENTVAAPDSSNDHLQDQ